MSELPILQPKTCGSCTMCCKLLGVIELEKPTNVWCEHCDKGVGCKIYATRPQTCRDFECLWLQIPEMPDELKPDRSKVVLTPTSDEEGIVAFIDPAYPNSHRSGDMGRMLKIWSQEQNMVIIACIGEERQILFSGTHIPEKFKKMIKDLEEQ